MNSLCLLILHNVTNMSLHHLAKAAWLPCVISACVRVSESLSHCEMLLHPDVLNHHQCLHHTSAQLLSRKGNHCECLQSTLAQTVLRRKKKERKKKKKEKKDVNIYCQAFTCC